MKTLLGGSCLGALLAIAFCVLVAAVIVLTNWGGFSYPT